VAQLIMTIHGHGYREAGASARAGADHEPHHCREAAMTSMWQGGGQVIGNSNS
jgi:hypothetical protein